VLAGLNLVVALPLILWVESMDRVYVRDYYAPRAKVAEIPAAPPAAAHGSEDEASPINPCGMLVDYPLQEKIVQLAYMPASVATGWRVACRPRWSLSARFHLSGWGPRTPSSIAKERKADIGLLLSICVLWILVGSFPLRRPEKQWQEPGMFITICAVVSVALVFIPFLEGLAEVSALFAGLGWFWWLGLLVWTVVRSGWRWTARRSAMDVR
jgi:hypothetical protein